LVAGISVGSEDLYRISPTGIAAGSNPGADPNTLVGYISRVRETIKDSCLKDIPIGHVDTWTAYVNGTNKPVIDAIDFIGFDAYPYFEDTKTNPVGEGKNLFQSALDQTRAVVGNKPIWITETGWPVSGKVSGQAVASIENARSYWTQVGCSFFNTTNVWWYTLQDASPDTPNPSFGVVGSTLSTKPIYDLSCPAAAAKRDEVPRQVPAGAKRSWNIARQNEAGNSSVTPAGTATSTGSGNVPLSTGSSGSGSGIGSGSPGSGSQGGSGSDSGSGSPTGEAGSNSINSYSAVVVALFLAIMIL
jgi:glucan endo-1,3-beta-D-glucosidase